MFFGFAQRRAREFAAAFFQKIARVRGSRAARGRQASHDGCEATALLSAFSIVAAVRVARCAALAGDRSVFFVVTLAFRRRVAARPSGRISMGLRHSLPRCRARAAIVVCQVQPIEYSLSFT